MSQNLIVKEIYKSIQGESIWNGWPCIFVRLAGCPLRCNWCDTVYGFKGGDKFTISYILDKIKTYNVKCVELTGGEPLAQSGSIELMQKLIENNYQVLLETSGSMSLEFVPQATHIIMDLKCPDSKMSEHNLYSNFKYLKTSDEIKLVIASHDDFNWACKVIKDFELEYRFKVSMSPAWGLVHPQKLVQWLLDSNLNVRLNLQIHKYIWSPKTKGV